MIMIIFAIVFLIVCVGMICFRYSKEQFEDLNIKLNEAEKHLDIYLEKKIELLNRLIKLMKKKKITAEYPDVEQYKKTELEKRNLHHVLFDTYTDMIQIVDEKEDKLTDEKSISFLDQLSDNEDDLIATVKYYNDNATEFNHLLHHFPTSITAHFLKMQQLEFYYNEKRETFEILKEK